MMQASMAKLFLCLLALDLASSITHAEGEEVHEPDAYDPYYEGNLVSVKDPPTHLTWEDIWKKKDIVVFKRFTTNAKGDEMVVTVTEDASTENSAHRNDVVRFYRLDGSNYQSLYTYSNERGYIGMADVPGEGGDLMLVFNANVNMRFVIFRIRDDVVTVTWDDLNKQWPEFVQIDSDRECEIVAWGGYRLRESGDERDPYIYKFLGDRYEMVENTRWEDRLLPRKLPNVPLKSSDSTE